MAHEIYIFNLCKFKRGGKAEALLEGGTCNSYHLTYLGIAPLDNRRCKVINEDIEPSSAFTVACMNSIAFDAGAHCTQTAFSAANSPMHRPADKHGSYVYSELGRRAYLRYQMCPNRIPLGARTRCHSKIRSLRSTVVILISKIFSVSAPISAEMRIGSGVLRSQRRKDSEEKIAKQSCSERDVRILSEGLYIGSTRGNKHLVVSLALSLGVSLLPFVQARRPYHRFSTRQWKPIVVVADYGIGHPMDTLVICQLSNDRCLLSVVTFDVSEALGLCKHSPISSTKDDLCWPIGAEVYVFTINCLFAAPLSQCSAPETHRAPVRVQTPSILTPHGRPPGPGGH
ncbi:hypothetical protein EVAR_89735_1 [Eumeta japonica]|uniref:Uncharacterized protein n=1 Tax=Eumeta variegata TaxID=151549 RepID=A0A4C1Y4J0_EUMVA|nr:hypothetical protein EVAR_89735_1 [Eumeta japonica]